MKNKTFYFALTLLLAGSVVFWGWMFQQPSDDSLPVSVAEDEPVEITMYHGEGCMCCVRWADYLEQEGFLVTDKLVDDLYEIKQEYGVSGRLSSCHTAIVDGYVVEGHVPAEDIRRLLAEQPDAAGIAVPGMPPSAPGMDAPVSREYQVLLFDREGNLSVYAVHD